MKNILITGGCGFIGSNFIRHMLKSHDYKIINLDALTYAGNLENLKDVESNPRYKFIRGRIESSELVSKVMQEQKVDALVHFAAESHVDRSIMDSAPFIKTNITGTHVLLEAAKSAGIEKFIHISTDEVYGSLDAESVFTEDTPLSPNSPYSASKASSDLLVRAYINTYKLPAIIIRCSNNYGPYQFPEKFIPLSISNALGDASIPVYGDGLNVRDWIHVDDFSRAIDLIFHKAELGQVYNVGGDTQLTNLDVLNAILDKLNKPKSLMRFVQDRPGHDRRYAMCTKKLEQAIGWKPQFSFGAGLTETIDWYQKNKGWWERIKSGDYIKYYDRMYGERLKEAETDASS